MSDLMRKLKERRLRLRVFEFLYAFRSFIVACGKLKRVDISLGPCRGQGHGVGLGRIVSDMTLVLSNPEVQVFAASTL